jgi:hypothetical protein
LGQTNSIDKFNDAIDQAIHPPMMYMGEEVVRSAVDEGLNDGANLIPQKSGGCWKF